MGEFYRKHKTSALTLPINVSIPAMRIEVVVRIAPVKQKLRLFPCGLSVVVRLYEPNAMIGEGSTTRSL